MNRILPSSLVIACWFVPSSANADDLPTVAPYGLSLEVRIASSSPLPFQPLRVRIVVQNNAQTKSGPLNPIERCCDFFVVAPEAKNFTRPIAQISIREQDEPDALLLEDPRQYPNLAKGQHLSGCVALLPAVASNEDAKLAHRKWLDPGRYLLKVRYYAGIDKNDKDVYLSGALPFEIHEPKLADSLILSRLRLDSALSNTVSETVELPKPDLVPKLIELLGLYGKKKVEIAPTFPNQPPRFVERDDYGPNSYALYIHFALARYYLLGKEFANRPRIAAAMAAEHLERVIDFPFAYHPNALIFGARCGFFDDHVQSLILNHYTDTAEFLAKQHRLFENAEWRETDEKYAKFRKTIPKPFPPPPGPPATKKKFG